MTKRFVSLFALCAALATQFSWAAEAPPSMPAPVETTDWILADASVFENGKIKYCLEHDRFMGVEVTCKRFGLLTPQDLLRKIGPANATLTGFTPQMYPDGSVKAILLYYKRS